MTPESVIDIGRHTLYIVMLITAPLLLSGLAISLLVSVIQTATQINEMSLSFIPKLITAGVVLAVGGPWMLKTLVEFTKRLIEGLPGAIG